MTRLAYSKTIPINICPQIEDKGEKQNPFRAGGRKESITNWDGGGPGGNREKMVSGWALQAHTIELRETGCGGWLGVIITCTENVLKYTQELTCLGDRNRCAWRGMGRKTRRHRMLRSVHTVYGLFQKIIQVEGQKATPELLSITAWTTMFSSRQVCTAVQSHYVGVPLPKLLVISYGPKYLNLCSWVVSAQYHAHKRVPPRPSLLLSASAVGLEPRTSYTLGEWATPHNTW